MDGAGMRLAGLKTTVIAPGILLGGLALTSPAYQVDTRFVSGHSAIAIPFELVDNQIHLRASVNDSRPLSFVLDTGSQVNLLSLRHAKSFGMKLQSLGKSTGGVGSQPVDMYLVTDKVSFSLPGVALSGQSLLATSLDMPPECASQSVKQGEQRVIDGVLGKGLFDSVVVEIDYAARLINLHDPQKYKYVGKGESLSLEMDDGLTILITQVKAPGQRPVSARLWVDTGGATALTLNVPFAEAHKILPPADKLRPTNECGIGGAAEGTSFEGRLEWMQFGGFKLSNPLTFFRKNPNGEGFDGLLGGGVLRNFKVIFDYSRRRMILEPPAGVTGAR